MRTLLIWTIRLLLWVGLPSLIGIIGYKFAKHDTAVWHDEIERIEKEDGS